MLKFRDILPQPPWKGLPIPRGLANKTKQRNPQGGITQAPFKVKSLDKSKEITLTGIVDTGAIYSTIPTSAIEQLGLPQIGVTSLTLLDGRNVTARMFIGIMEIEGREIGTTFSSLGNGFITIGVRDLEGLGFKVNPSTGKLEPTAILG